MKRRTLGWILQLYAGRAIPRRDRATWRSPKERELKIVLKVFRNVFPSGHTMPMRLQKGELTARNYPSSSTCRPPPETQAESQPVRYTCLVAGRPTLASSARVGSTFPRRYSKLLLRALLTCTGVN